MAWLHTPIMAPVALFIGYFFYSPTVMLRAAREEAGLPVGAALKRSLPRPVLSSLLLLGLLVPARIVLTRLTPMLLVTLLAVAGVTYGVLGLLVILEPGERNRLAQIWSDAVRRMMGRSDAREDPPPGA